MLACDRWCCLLKLNHCSKHIYETSCYKAVSFKFGMSVSQYAQSYLKISFMFLHWDNFITIVFRNFSDNRLTFIWHENVCILSQLLLTFIRLISWALLSSLYSVFLSCNREKRELSQKITHYVSVLIFSEHLTVRKSYKWSVTGLMLMDWTHVFTFVSFENFTEIKWVKKKRL